LRRFLVSCPVYLHDVRRGGAESRNIETSKGIDLEKFVSHGDLDPIY
jgi:hypothetical protein